MKLGVKAAVLAGVMGMALFGTADASACLRAMETPESPDRPDAAHLVAQAEQALDAGKGAIATASMVKLFPSLRTALTQKAELGHLEHRAARIVALASVRSDGGFGVVNGKVKDKNKTNLDWSVGILRKLNAGRPGDASLQADLGEALAKQPETQKEALEVLSKLASDDLIGSPHAYAALAKLEAARGEAQKSADAVRRCEGMTSTPSICSPAKPAAVPAATPKPEPAIDLKSRA